MLGWFTNQLANPEGLEKAHNNHGERKKFSINMATAQIKMAPAQPRKPVLPATHTSSGGQLTSRSPQSLGPKADWPGEQEERPVTSPRKQISQGKTRRELGNLSFIMVVKHTRHKRGHFNHFSVYNSMAPSTFSLWCNPHDHPAPGNLLTNSASCPSHSASRLHCPRRRGTSPPFRC